MRTLCIIRTRSHNTYALSEQTQPCLTYALQHNTVRIWGPFSYDHLVPACITLGIMYRDSATTRQHPSVAKGPPTFLDPWGATKVELACDCNDFRCYMGMIMPSTAS